jgi:hypothetical protein
MDVDFNTHIVDSSGELFATSDKFSDGSLVGQGQTYAQAQEQNLHCSNSRCDSCDLKIQICQSVSKFYFYSLSNL